MTVPATTTGQDFLASLPSQTFDLYVIERELPDTSGNRVVEEIRNRAGRKPPVLLVSRRGEREDMITALDSGADDCMLRQFAEDEFLTRINSLSQPRIDSSTRITIGSYDVDVTHAEIRNDGQRVRLTSKDFELALYLFRNVGRLLSRTSLLKDVWGIEAPVNTRTVDVHVSRLRKALKLNASSPLRIRTVYQHGYRLEVRPD